MCQLLARGPKRATRRAPGARSRATPRASNSEPARRRTPGRAAIGHRRARAEQPSELELAELVRRTAAVPPPAAPTNNRASTRTSAAKTRPSPATATARAPLHERRNLLRRRVLAGSSATQLVDRRCYEQTSVLDPEHTDQQPLRPGQHQHGAPETRASGCRPAGSARRPPTPRSRSSDRAHRREHRARSPRTAAPSSEQSADMPSRRLHETPARVPRRAVSSAINAGRA